MSVANRNLMDLAAYEALAARDLDGMWELWDGVPREKPGMSWEHNDLSAELGRLIGNQIDRNAHRVRINAPRVRWSDRNVFIPDVAVVPMAEGAAQRGQPGLLEAYAAPLPLVIEVWSRSTGEYDLDVKLAAYKARGDAEVWLVHPYQRVLQRWIRQDDGSYVESVHERGAVAISSLPGVEVDLDALFAMLD